MSDEAAAEQAAAQAKPKRRKPQKVRGLFERPTGSDLWWIRYTDAAGRERREKAGTRGMAIALLDKRKGERLRQVKLPETLRAKPVLFAEIAADCLEYSQAHKASADHDRRSMPLLLAKLGALPAASITPQQVERALNQLAQERGWKPATWNRLKALASLAFRLAVQNGKAPANPVRNVRRKREDSARTRWLAPEEEARLRAAIEAHYPDQLPAFLLSLNTGMRRSEQYQRIIWDGVDFEQRRLWVPGSKNGTARNIPLNDAALGALLALRDRADGTGNVMRAGVGGHGKLAGQELKTPKQWFAAACRKAGLTDYTWHANRHTFASRLVMAGVPLRSVQELMGHKSIVMTCRYAHLAPQHQLDAVLKLDGWGREQGVLAGVQTGTRTGTGGLERPGPTAPGAAQIVVQ